MFNESRTINVFVDMTKFKILFCGKQGPVGATGAKGARGAAGPPVSMTHNFM